MVSDRAVRLAATVTLPDSITVWSAAVGIFGVSPPPSSQCEVGESIELLYEAEAPDNAATVSAWKHELYSQSCGFGCLALLTIPIGWLMLRFF